MYFDHPYEPDPEERGYYWGPRYTDTRKVFGYDATDVYNNIDVTRFGDPLTKDDICKDKNDEDICEVLTETENIIGKSILNVGFEYSLYKTFFHRTLCVLLKQRL